MDNYKIKVKDEAESKEAQELFFELGFQWHKEEKGVFWETTSGFIFANGNTKILFGGVFGDADTYTPITIPQLRDLVAQSKLKAPALISGADAKLVEQAKKFITSDHLNRFEAAEAHLEGHPVQFMLANGDFIDITSDTTLGIFEKDGGYSFRLKPQTIKVELEIPAPFQPKEGEQCCYISDESIDGYHTVSYNSEKYSGMHFGLYRPSDIEKVVALFRSAFGGAS